MVLLWVFTYDFTVGPLACMSPSHIRSSRNIKLTNDRLHRRRGLEHSAAIQDCRTGQEWIQRGRNRSRCLEHLYDEPLGVSLHLI
jgi:hypothetical protein